MCIRDSLKCTRKPSQEDRGSKEGRIFCINSQHDPSNEEAGNKPWSDEADVVSGRDSYPHSDKNTWEIALSPNPGWTSRLPLERDYILKMSKVLATNLRARLVVLSCCHSGRAESWKVRVWSVSHVPSWQLVLVLCWWPCEQEITKLPWFSRNVSANI